MILLRWRMGGLGYGASKPNIENRMWGIIDTSKKDREYITEWRHLPSRALTACFSPLPRREAAAAAACWIGALKKNIETCVERFLQDFSFFPIVHLIPYAVSYAKCHAMFRKFCTEGSLFCTLWVSCLGLMGEKRTGAEQEHGNTCCCSFKDMSHLLILGPGKI